jgi:hypothetical protein
MLLRVCGTDDYKAHWRQRWTRALSTDLCVRSQSQSLRPVAVLNTSWRGADHLAQLKCGTDGIVGVNLLQSLTRSVFAGGEVIYSHRTAQTEYALGAFVDNALCTAGVRVASVGHMCLDYMRKVTPSVGLATNLIVTKDRAALARFGYTVALKRANARLSGCLNSLGSLTSTVEERIGKTMRLLLTATINPLMHDYSFGIILQTGPTADERMFGSGPKLRKHRSIIEDYMRDEDKLRHEDGRRSGFGNAMEFFPKLYPDSRILYAWRIINH